MADTEDPALDAISFRIDPEKKVRLQQIAKDNFRTLTGHMNYLVDQCLLASPIKKSRKDRNENAEA